MARFGRLRCGRPSLRRRRRAGSGGTPPPEPSAQCVVFSPLGEPRYALGLETIYEGYLVHYGEPRLFAPPDDDTALLLGDYLYAHGVVRVAAPMSRPSPTSPS